MVQPAKKQQTLLSNYVSFSGVKDWKFCPHYFKLTRIDKVYKFEGNIHTSFGTAIHEAVEFLLLNERVSDKNYLLNETNKKFLWSFKKMLSGLDEKPDLKLVEEMKKQAPLIFKGVLPQLRKEFGNFTVISTEEQLNIPLEEYKLNEFQFKGFIDLIIKTEDGKYHVIDWKTCSWGWNMKKKTDPMVNYQLTYYKHFYAKKAGIDLKDIETYFILLKRTAKKENVEVYRVSSGQRKMTSALTLLENAVHNIDHGNHVKNKTSCRQCPVWKTLCEG
jgi:ATP-dependent exoDNAse (exonuclease V) beta subunit